MEWIWNSGLILLLAGAGILSARLWCYRKQVRHMREELEELERNRDTNRLLSSALPVGETGEVIAAMNRILERERHAREHLERENHSYRESITSISHDIRTPLTSAKGYVQMLGEEGLGEEKQKAYRQIVERRLADLSGMLDQLFLYARLEAGEAEYVWETLQAGNLFAETLSLFYEEFTGRGQEPEIRMPTGTVYIRADRQAFVRILENLVKNALVHGNGGYCFALEQEGEKVRISVENHTDSICQEELGQIFDRFYTTDTSRSRRTTGLGLAIVKGLTQQMGGEVSATLSQGVFRIEVCFPCLQNP